MLSKKLHFLLGIGNLQEAEILKNTIAQYGKFEIIYTDSFIKLEDHISKKQFDFIICELKMPDGDAITFAHSVKKQNNTQDPYYIILSEDENAFIQNAAYNAGVNDYLIKPISEKNIGLKIKNLIQYLNNKNNEAKQPEGIIVDEEKYSILKNNVSYFLPGKEFEIVKMFSHNPLRIFTREEIAQQIWGTKDVANTRIIDVHITHIRKVLGKTSIRSVKKRGYGLNNN